MNYFDHNTVTEGCKRIRAAAQRARTIADFIAPNNFGALFASAHVTRERRLEGARLHKRGMVNEMPYHLYGAKCRRAAV